MFDEWLDGRELALTPAIDVVREDGRLVVRADLPGLKPEEVKKSKTTSSRSLVNATSARIRRRRTSCGGNRRYGSFSRSMAVPAGVDPKTIEAKTHYGVVETTP